jgi:hypothetical protein
VLRDLATGIECVALAGERGGYLSMRLILEPSSVRLYIRPFRSKMNPTIGLVMLLVSIAPPAPMAMMVIEPSMPTFQPSVA